MSGRLEQQINDEFTADTDGVAFLEPLRIDFQRGLFGQSEQGLNYLFAVGPARSEQDIDIFRRPGITMRIQRIAADQKILDASFVEPTSQIDNIIKRRLARQIFFAHSRARS